VQFLGGLRPNTGGRQEVSGLRLEPLNPKPQTLKETSQTKPNKQTIKTKQTNRQTNKQTNKTNKQAKQNQPNKQTKQTNKQTNQHKHTNKQTDRQTNNQTNKRTNKQTDRQTDKQNKQTNKTNKRERPPASPQEVAGYPWWLHPSAGRGCAFLSPVWGLASGVQQSALCPAARVDGLP
jgi:hypothetical protein